LLSVIDESNIHFVFYENLFTDLEIASLCSFLDIEHEKADYSYRPNSSFDEKITKEYRRKIYERFSYVYHFINDYFKGEIPENWKQDIIDFKPSEGDLKNQKEY